MNNEVLQFRGAARRRRPPRKARAFTLVELLLVLVLVALLSGAMAAGLTGRQDRMVLRAAGEDLAATIRYAAAQARLRRTAYRLAFDDAGSAWRLEIRSPDAVEEFAAATGEAGRWRMLGEKVRVREAVLDGQARRGELAPLGFDPRGEFFHGTVELASRSGGTVAVAVGEGAFQTRVVEESP